MNQSYKVGLEKLPIESLETLKTDIQIELMMDCVLITMFT